MAKENSATLRALSDECLITIGGKTMTTAEYKKLRKEQEIEAIKKAHGGKLPKKRKKVTKTQKVAESVRSLVKTIKPIKSLAAYYDNGYRQWGTIARTIIDHKGIKAPFLRFRVSVREMNSIIKDIETFGKRNEKDIYQFVEKLSYKLDDVRGHMEDLVKGVNDTRVCEFYDGEECISGEGRRLGLRILMVRSLQSIYSMGELIKKLDATAKEGIDIFEYDDKTYKRKYKNS